MKLLNIWCWIMSRVINAERQWRPVLLLWNGATSVEMQKGAYPTGRFAVLTKSAAKRVFGDIAEKNGKVFVDVELFSQLFPSK